jgi:dTDP-4-dehydrorhamnose 3,5-epimerase-like enzyme
MSVFRWVELTKIEDCRGSLVPVTAPKDTSFEIKRVYYLYGTPSGVARGFHAHRKLKQILVVVAGSCRVTLDDGHKRIEVQLNDPSKGILIEGMIWRILDQFSENCVLLVLASEPYDESDYIRDYDQFINAVEVQTGSK